MTNYERVDADYDGLWTEDLLLWILAWINLVDKTTPAVPDDQEINQGDDTSRLVLHSLETE